jgi:hypothetical protein
VVAFKTYNLETYDTLIPIPPAQGLEDVFDSGVGLLIVLDSGTDFVLLCTIREHGRGSNEPASDGVQRRAHGAARCPVNRGHLVGKVACSIGRGFSLGGTVTTEPWRGVPSDRVCEHTGVVEGIAE